jgi:hypothetical protein
MLLSPTFRLSRLAGPIAACIAFAVSLALVGGPAGAQAPLKQIKLTEQHIQGFIAAQKPMSEVTDKMQGATPDKPDPKIQAELEAAAKKSGFKDFTEYDDVAANISMVMAGIDPQTKTFTEPQVAIRNEIKEVEADKSLKADERKAMLTGLNAALKSATPMQFPENVALVTRYFDKIDAVLQ